jgi:alkylation response protein AidB-like acyl-CoA dehydrogenase
MAEEGRWIFDIPQNRKPFAARSGASSQTPFLRSMALFGTLTLIGEDIHQRWPILAAMKVQIGRSARFIGQSAIQLHGGIGMASEYPVGHYFRRLTAIELLLGDADHHLATLVDAGGLLCAAG